VIYTKEGEDGHKFTIIDAAFNDLMRPALYDAYHEILPVQRKDDRKQIVTDIVGPICETGDTFSKGRTLQQTAPGELLAIMSAGAYGMSMASTYNSRGRCSEILVKDRQYYVVRKPERLEDIMGKEDLPEFLKDKG
jgi:diaminopimelate decarboxylase